MRNILIIGNGIAGITAARTIRKRSSDSITVISGETDYFYSRTALMYIYMGHMTLENTQPYEKWFWKKNNIQLKKAWVQAIQTDKQELLFTDGESMSYDVLIIASGSKSNKFDWPGQDLKGVQGLYSYQDLLQLEQTTSQQVDRAIIVGGGLIGIELAEMLHSRHIPVTFLVREKSFWNNILPAGESAMINKHILDNGIDLRLGDELKQIISDENGQVKAIETPSGEIIDCQLVGLTAGVSPNIDFVKKSNIKSDRGILVDHTFRTNIPNVYAIGDCAQFKEPLAERRPIEQVWYTGKMHGEIAGKNITGEAVIYQPGPWFNSAKFFDIEYQTYGTVAAKPADYESRLYWESDDAMKCIHLVYHNESKEFIGMNTFGIRYRHEFFDTVLREKKSIEYVLKHLATANFDPELYAQYEPRIIAQYNQLEGTNLSNTSKRGLKHFLKALTK